MGNSWHACRTWRARSFLWHASEAAETSQRKSSSKRLTDQHMPPPLFFCRTTEGVEMIFSGENRTSDHVKTLFLLFNDIRPFSGENRTSEDEKISFLCSSLTFSGENRTSEDVKTSFLCSSLTFSGENRTSEDVKISFLCSSLTFSGENRTSEDVKTSFFCYSLTFSERTGHQRTCRIFFCSSPAFSGETRTVGWHAEKFGH